MDEQATDEKRRADEPLTMVGIGASAGGLAALQGFFDALPATSGLAYVVVTHMDPHHESLLPELLQRHTTMPVQAVTGPTPIEAEHVYVISPNRHIQITDTHLDAQRFEEPRGHRTPVDYFFRNLAQVHPESVAVILSGGGTDGAVGVKAIKERGGLLLVQDPAEAEYGSMPRAALNSGLADAVLPVAALAEKLVSFRQSGLEIPSDPEELTAGQIDTMFNILSQVQVQTGHDFSRYKQATLLRRIQRRMQLDGHSSLETYLASLRREPAEARTLFNDLLIGVTNFFRDHDAWQALAEQILPRLFAGKTKNDTVRVWSIGCATGEEAYSLGILLLEAYDGLPEAIPDRPGVQLFASDLDDNALTRAREGIYPEAIEADVSPERLDRFFTKEGNHYRVRPELRDLVLFSNHSVLRDPPFSRLDLISCRNLLIYLNRELQDNVFQIFHYALNPESYLFLGSSESVETAGDLFRTVDKEHRFFQARPWRGERLHLPTLPLALNPRSPSYSLAHPPAGAGEMPTPARSVPYHAQILEETAPPSALVNEEHQVLHLSDEAGRYLQLPGGALTSNILNLVRPALQHELQAALYQALEEGQNVVSAPVPIILEGEARQVIMAVRPRRPWRDEEGAGTEGTPLALVFFLEGAGDPLLGAGAEDAAAGEEGEQNRDPRVARLEAEAARLRERLQVVTEEYNSSSEELKAANEELQSINEEYRSTTEELETSKEELQSVNEELQTVNAELKNKLEEISRAHSDIENLMAATNIATLFLDRQLRIQRYTPATADLFNVMPGDRGRPIAHLTNTLSYEELVADARQVLKTLVPVEREIRDAAGRWFLAQVHPYRTVDDRISGVVLSFVDISELKEAQAAAAVAALEEHIQAILESVTDPVYAVDADWQLVYANSAVSRLWGRPPAELLGANLWDLFPEGRATDGAESHLRAMETREPVTSTAFWPALELWAQLNIYPVGDGGLAIYFRDVSERQRSEAEVRRAYAYSRAITGTIREGLLVLDPDLRVEYANDAFYKLFVVAAAETEGRLIYELGNGQWDIPELRRLLEEILPEEKVLNDYRVVHTFEHIGRRVMLLNARQLEEHERILLAIEQAPAGEAQGGE